MSYNLGSYNREGKVEDLELKVETVSDEAAPAAEEAETVDADADGHDDETGQFVEGNQEAADPADESAAATDDTSTGEAA